MKRKPAPNTPGTKSATPGDGNHVESGAAKPKPLKRPLKQAWFTDFIYCYCDEGLERLDRGIIPQGHWKEIGGKRLFLTPISGPAHNRAEGAIMSSILPKSKDHLNYRRLVITQKVVRCLTRAIKPLEEAHQLLVKLAHIDIPTAPLYLIREIEEAKDIYESILKKIRGTRKPSTRHGIEKVGVALLKMEIIARGCYPDSPIAIIRRDINQIIVNHIAEFKLGPIGEREGKRHNSLKTSILGKAKFDALADARNPEMEIYGHLSECFRGGPFEDAYLSVVNPPIPPERQQSKPCDGITVHRDKNGARLTRGGRELDLSTLKAEVKAFNERGFKERLDLEYKKFIINEMECFAKEHPDCAAADTETNPESLSTK